MVVGTLQHVPSKGRISIMKIQNFTVQKRYSVIRLSYGLLLVTIGTIMAAINPLSLITNWFLDMKEGSYLFRMWEKPTFEIFSDMWVYNYTNVQEFLSGADKVMKVKEIGPFKYREVRTNENMKIDHQRGVMTMNPTMKLELQRDQSIDDPNNVTVMMPNVPLIAISTLAADQLGYLANAGAFYSMSALGAKLFKPLTVEQMFWGYKDPLVTIANKLLPGWIDFSKIGIVDRFYSGKREWSEVEIGNISRRYSLNSWDNSTGLVEQGFTDLNTSTPCNRIRGSYEGLMVSPSIPKGQNITMFRKQACKNFPFHFVEERTLEEFGFSSYRYQLDEDAFSSKSEYACSCKQQCLPEGFVDISECYYGFPIALSKPHYTYVDPKQQSYFEGMIPDKEKYVSYLEIEPTIGAPLNLAMKIQINLAVRTSSANPITSALDHKIVPLLWFSLHLKQPPADIVTLLRLRLVIGPPIMIVLDIILLAIGLFLSGQGLHRIWKPKYKILSPKEAPAPMRRKSQERRRSSVILNIAENIAFKSRDDLAKEAVSLLAIREDEGEFNDLLLSDHECD